MNWLEAAAVVLNLIYVWLAAYGNVWCWPAGIAGALCYVFFNLDLKYYQDAMLQSYYVLAGCYGWYYWKQGSSQQAASVTVASPSQQLRLFFPALVLTAAMGFLFAQTDARKPYLDAFTTVFSFFATWMTTRKILQSWLWWIVIDVLLAYQYVIVQAWFSASLYLLFTFMAIFGFVNWRKSLHPQPD